MGPFLFLRAPVTESATLLVVATTTPPESAVIMKKLSDKEIATRKQLLSDLQGKLKGWHKDSVSKQFGSVQKMAHGGTIQDESNAEKDAALHNEAVAEDNAGDADHLVDMPKDGGVPGSPDVDEDSSSDMSDDSEMDAPKEKSGGVKLEDLIASLSKGK